MGSRAKRKDPPYQRVRVLGYTGEQGEFTLVLVPVNKDGSDKRVPTGVVGNHYFTVVKKVTGGAGNLGAKNLARFLGFAEEFIQDDRIYRKANKLE
jgi:hypothetical protein